MPVPDSYGLLIAICWYSACIPTSTAEIDCLMPSRSKQFCSVFPSSDLLDFRLTSGSGFPFRLLQLIHIEWVRGARAALIFALTYYNILSREKITPNYYGCPIVPINRILHQQASVFSLANTIVSSMQLNACHARYAWLWSPAGRPSSASE